MKKIFLLVGIFCVFQILTGHFAEAQTKKAKSKKAAVVVKTAPTAKTLPAPPSAQAAAATMPKPKEEPVVILPPMGDYKYEVNFAPLALIANWYAIDVLKYEPSVESGAQSQQFGYGITAVSFVRNNNDFDDTFPSRSGYGAGLVATWDFRDYYYSTHGYYEKFERYQDKGTLVQEREGFRVTGVVGLKEVIKRRYALKFGAGIEVETYKVREFHETNRFVQTNYQTNILNPLFLECKLAMYF
jgi:hypothetical protein